MRTGKRALLAVVVPLLLGAAAGCAGGAEGGGSASPGAAAERGTSGSPTTRGADGTAGSAGAVVSVRLVISGGIAGTHEVYVVRRDEAGGTPSARVARILTLAGDVTSSGVGRAQRRGSGACCDIPVVDLTIRYADGTRTHVRTAQTMPAAPKLRRLLTLMSASG